MRNDFTLVNGRLRSSDPDVATVTIYHNPTAQEQRELVDTLGIDEHTLGSTLDPEEVSRLETHEDPQLTFILWKRPRRRSAEHPELLGLASVSMFLRSDRLNVIASDDTPLLHAGDIAASLRDLVLKILAITVNEFVLELKDIKQLSRDIQAKVSESLENRELLRMFDLSEGLIYHIDAIDANASVLNRLRRFARQNGFDKREVEYLDDIAIDNGQCSRQAHIFSAVLGGLMDARGNIINNNMNVLLKNLTIINVVFLPLNVIASIGGMSEFSMMIGEYAIDWRLGYAAFTAAMAASGFILWIVLNARITRAPSNGVVRPGATPH